MFSSSFAGSDTVRRRTSFYSAQRTKRSFDFWDADRWRTEHSVRCSRHQGTKFPVSTPCSVAEMKALVHGSLRVFQMLYFFQPVFGYISFTPLTKCTRLLVDIFLMHGLSSPEKSECCVSFLCCVITPHYVSVTQSQRTQNTVHRSKCYQDLGIHQLFRRLVCKQFSHSTHYQCFGTVVS